MLLTPVKIGGLDRIVKSPSRRSYSHKTKVITVTVPSYKGVSQLPISNGSKLLFFGITSFTNKNNLCWSNKTTLSERSGISRNNINRYLNELLEWNLISYVNEKTILVHSMITFKKEVEQRPSFEQPADVPSQIPLKSSAYSADTSSYSGSTYKDRSNKEQIKKEGVGSYPGKERLVQNTPPSNTPIQKNTSVKEPKKTLNDLPDDVPKNLGNIWLVNSPKMNQILIDKVTKKMISLKNRHYDDGWSDQNIRSEYFKLKSFVKFGQKELYGVDLLVV